IKPLSKTLTSTHCCWRFVGDGLQAKTAVLSWSPQFSTLAERSVAAQVTRTWVSVDIQPSGVRVLTRQNQAMFGRRPRQVKVAAWADTPAVKKVPGTKPSSKTLTSSHCSTASCLGRHAKVTSAVLPPADSQSTR